MTQNLALPTISPELNGEITGTTAQIAILNNLLPRGFRFEPYESARRLDPSLISSGKRKTVVSIIGTI